MGKTLPLVFVISFVIATVTCFSQSFQVSEPTMELRGNVIYIFYDILNSVPSEKFSVDLVVTDANGNRVNAASLTGDVGDLVTGGDSKQIAWDLTEDKIEMNANIFVKVYVEAIQSPAPIVVPVIIESTENTDNYESPIGAEINKQTRLAEDFHVYEGLKDDVIQEEQVVQEIPIVENSNIKEMHQSFNRTGIFFQSLLIPGLGLSRVTGKPHWLRGVAGYGCIAGAVVMNRKAIATYDDIVEQIDLDDKRDLYQSALSQDQTSEILAYTAIAIWVSDMIWTLVGTSDLKKSFSANSRKGVLLYSSIDPVSSTPLIGLTLSF